ncbi:MAG: hypothetical protein ACOYM3_22485 [Terrimicrobiaceae bacterium]
MASGVELLIGEDPEAVERLDLSLGQAGRILWSAKTRWSWLSDALRKKIKTAFARLLEHSLPYCEMKYGSIETKADVLQATDPFSLLQNIPMIATVSLALAAAEFVWWIFGFGAIKPEVEFEGSKVLVDGHRFDCHQEPDRAIM